MRAFVAMNNYLIQVSQYSAELAELRSRLLLVEREVRENLEAMEDTASTRRPSMWNFSSKYTTLDTKKDFTSGLPKSKIRVVHSGCSFIEGSESS